MVNSKALIHTDPGLLERIVHNLLTNAFLHAQATKILIGCRRRDAEFRIEVWDEGIGIPTDKLTDIFEEFYQLDNPNRDRSKRLVWDSPSPIACLGCSGMRSRCARFRAKAPYSP